MKLILFKTDCRPLFFARFEMASLSLLSRILSSSELQTSLPAVYQRKHVRNNFSSEVSHTIKIQNFDLQNWSDIFVQEHFYLPG